MNKMQEKLSDGEYAHLTEEEEALYQEAVERLLEAVDFDEYRYMTQEERAHYCALQMKIGRVDSCQCGKHDNDISSE
jgi:peptide subunit release factor 1 (eRF1)